jgi:type I restriction enzyme S subunit
VTTSPANWRHTTLGAIGHYWNGRGFKKSEWRQSGRPIIRIQNLTGSGKGFNYYDGTAEEHYIARQGDLLISWAATLGAYIWNGPEAVVNQHIFKVESLIDLRFHKYLLDFKLGELMRRAHGSGMVHVTRKTFDNVPVAVPYSTDEQRQIVAALEDHLSRLDAADAYLQAATKRGELLRPSWVLTKAEGSGRESTLAEVVLEAKTGWDRGRAFAVQPPAGHPYLKMNNIRSNGELDLTSTTHVDGDAKEAGRYQILTGDVLFNNRNSRELVGKAAVADERIEGWTYNNNLVRMRFAPGVVPAFAAMQMNGPGFRHKLSDCISGSTNVAAIYTRDLLRQSIWIPTLEHQAALVARYSEMSMQETRLSTSLDDQRRRLINLRGQLLIAAFNGRLTGRSADMPLVEDLANV